MRLFHFIALVLATATVVAQEATTAGRGSYASFPPTYKSRTDQHGGSYATMMETCRLFLDEDVKTPDGSRRPIPTNDWWTDLLNSQFADALWSYPQMVKPSQDGITINYPSYWIDNGTEVKSRSSLTVGAKNFQATAAIAADWHDWDVEMRLPGKKNGQIYATLAHGMPFTWLEFTDLTPTIKFSSTPTFYSADGAEISITNITGRTDTSLGVVLGSDVYGLFLPSGIKLKYSDGLLIIEGLDNPYISVGLLNNIEQVKEFATWAYSVPRATRVDWTYDEDNALLQTTWHVDAVNLRNPAAAAPVLQGFLPHVYKYAVSGNISYCGINYLSPRGTLQMATPRADNTFSFGRRFYGIMPHYAAPKASEAEHGFKPERLKSLMTQYANEGAFGSDTYWGGKGLIQMAMNMTFALEAGETELYEQCRKRLREVMINWLTYTPGEDNYFFAYYPRWGSLVGYEYSYDSDKFNDHHFHYGYMLYAGALLCLNDPDFKAGYGEMLKLVAKDFANWQHDDYRFPFLRTLDPWVGHSFAGGLGDGANDNGNGQESSSEAMQGWGGVYLMGVALGDNEMRDAGIFGWLTESAGVAEYWFDRDHIYSDRQHNYDYTLYDHPYNTNITCKGIGWWTWFSGDPLWMHSIQWMPVSPCLNYLSQDLNFVKWDYETFTQGTAYKWFETATRDGETLEPLAKQSVGNVVLSYLERYDPESAASIFDQAWDSNMPLARSTDTGHISYYVIHSHLTYGDPDYTVYASIPTANAYRKADGTMTYMAYNPGTTERTVNFYRDGTLLRSCRVAPSSHIICFSDEPTPASISIESERGAYMPIGSQGRISMRVIDNYGATYSGLEGSLSLSANAPATLTDGVLSINVDAPRNSEFQVIATADNLSAAYTITVNDSPIATEATFSPNMQFAEVGTALSFDAAITDQYGNAVAADSWSVTDASCAEVATSANFTPSTPGRYTITATSGSRQFSHSLYVTPLLSNIALGCNAYSSGEENAGCLTSHATDGDHSTRWGSLHTDDQWIYVDLGRICNITRVVIDWEAAYASSYEIQVASDGNSSPAAVSDWTTVKTVTGLSKSGTDSQAVSATGRYLRIHGLSRATVYGYSLYQIEVHGIPCDAADSDVIGLDVSVPAVIDEGMEYQFDAVAWTLAGDSYPVDAAWSCDMADASFTANRFIANNYGTVNITATTPDGLSAQTSAVVSESIKMSSVSVSPAHTSIILGDTAQLSVVAYNQFGGLWTDADNLTPVVYDITDEANPVLATEVAYDPASQTFTARTVGSYRLQFSGAQAVVDVVNVADANLALGKTATATTTRDNNVASNVTDGNTSTRWESEWTDNQSITIDLESPYVLNRVIMTWEGAYASNYDILVSLNGEEWTSVWHTSQGRGGNVTAEFSATAGRYVKLQCNSRGTGYGNSLYEIEVYGLSRYEDVGSVANVACDMAPVDVYNLQGLCLRRAVPAANALAGLPSGLYIVNNRKIMKH